MEATETTTAQNTNQAAVQSLGKETAPAQTTNQAAESAKPSSEPVAAKPTETTSKAPEAYDLKVAEGSHLDPARLESIKTYAKSKGLSNEQAQDLVNREGEAVKTYLDAQTQAYEKRKSEWATKAKDDQEIGGEAFTKNMELSHRVIKRFASEALVKELETTGLGNYPELVRVFSRIGKAMSDDQLVMGGTQAVQPKSIEQIFYPNMTKG